MKIALCFSGHIRDLNESKNFWTRLIKKYDIDVYASFWDIENAELGDTIKEFEKVYTPKRLEVESYEIFKNTTQEFASMFIESPNNINELFQKNSKIFGQLPMYYKIWKCNMLTKQLGIEYDLVIRARIDTVLDENFTIQKNDMLNVPMGNNYAKVFPNSFGINDCFAYAKPKIMDYYSFIYLKMMEYLKEGHYLFPPEHFLAVHFSKVKIQIRYFPTYMLITRKSKGTTHEIYNNFVKEPKETIVMSNSVQFSPDKNYSFYKDIINDFIV